MTPQYPPENGRHLEVHGWRNNPLVASGLDHTIKVFCQAPLRVYDRNSENDIPGHPLEKLMRRPEPRVFQFLFWLQTLLDWYLYGNVFWEIVRGKKTGRPMQLWRLIPHKLAIVPGKTKEVARFEYEIDGKWWPIPSRDVIHIRNHNPRDEWFGASPMIAAFRAIATDNQATDFLKLTLQNLAISPVALEIDGPQPNSEDAKEMKRQWKKNYGGSNTGEPMIVGGGSGGKVRVRQVGFSLEQLSFPNLSAYLETRVLMVLGGAPMVYAVGGAAALGANTYSNYAEARQAFVEEVVMPLWDMFDDVLATELLPQFPGSEALDTYFDLANVPGAEASRLKRLEAAGTGLSRGLLTLPQARRFAGVNAPNIGEVIYVPTNSDPWKIGAGGTLEPMIPAGELSKRPEDPDQLADQEGPEDGAGDEELGDEEEEADAT